MENNLESQVHDQETNEDEHMHRTNSITKAYDQILKIA